jgi:hypothetical protein
MKLFSILLFLFYFGSVSAQYQAIFGENVDVEWTLKYSATSCYFSWNAPKDTVWLDGIKYFVLHSGNKSSSLPILKYQFIFEDSSNRLWSTIDTTNTNYKLIMDLDLLVGDTFYFSPDSVVYYIVDSVYTDSNRKIIQFNNQFGLMNEKVKFIEGIGPNIGFDYMFNNLSWYNAYSLVVRKQKANTYEYIYHDTAFNSICLPSAIVNVDINAFELNLYPNPANETINIESSENIQSIEIYNLAGQLLIHQQLNTKYSTIDIEQLNKAVYIVKIKVNEADIQVHKFIKQ